MSSKNSKTCSGTPRPPYRLPHLPDLSSEEVNAIDTEQIKADFSLTELTIWVREFSRARDWEQFHHPKDLGVALACEVGELLEHVRYRTHEQVAGHLGNAEAHREFAHELADCLWLILRMADVTGVELAAALREKLTLAEAKYPVEKARGRPDKYTAYREPGEA